jgi:hypothetical protein
MEDHELGNHQLEHVDTKAIGFKDSAKYIHLCHLPIKHVQKQKKDSVLFSFCAGLLDE